MDHRQASVFHKHARGIQHNNKLNMLASNYCLCSYDPGIFLRKLSVIGWKSMSPCAFWKKSEQKVECQFNWCVWGCGCMLQISSGVHVKDKGLDTLICACNHDELLCKQSLKCWVLLWKEGAAHDSLGFRAPSMIPGWLVLHFNMIYTVYVCACTL